MSMTTIDGLIAQDEKIVSAIDALRAQLREVAEDAHLTDAQSYASLIGALGGVDAKLESAARRLVDSQAQRAAKAQATLMRPSKLARMRFVDDIKRAARI